VKLIGATAHHVTEGLEALALSRALKGHIERRVFVNGRRTVVLG
jgi:formyltetrahydrofolate hydrolase